MKTKIISFFFISLISCNQNKKLVIEPILVHKDFKLPNFAKVEYNEYPYARLEYFQIDNYKNLSNEELLNKLETYVNTHYDIEKVKNHDDYGFLFYKKSFFINYRNHMSEDEMGLETSSFLNYKDKNIAFIWYHKPQRENKKMSYTRIIYDKDSIVLDREDTLNLRL